MSFRVYELELAKQDVRDIFDWLLARSPDGAAAWLDAYDAAILNLGVRAPAHAKALEAEALGVDLRLVLFNTKHGGVYRAVFRVLDNDVFILRVRGPGQPTLVAGEVDKP